MYYGFENMTIKDKMLLNLQVHIQWGTGKVVWICK